MRWSLVGEEGPEGALLLEDEVQKQRKLERTMAAEEKHEVSFRFVSCRIVSCRVW